MTKNRASLPKSDQADKESVIQSSEVEAQAVPVIDIDEVADIQVCQHAIARVISRLFRSEVAPVTPEENLPSAA